MSETTVQSEKKAWNTVPESVKAAQEELKVVGTDKGEIDTQLGIERTVTGRFESAIEYHEWRRRALAAKRWHERRIRFLKAWIAEHEPPPDPSHRPAVFAADSVSSTVLARLLSRRIGQLESIYVGLYEYVRNQTDENWDALMRRLDEAHAYLSKPVGEQ